MGQFTEDKHLSRLSTELKKHLHVFDGSDDTVLYYTLANILALSIISEISEKKPVSTLLDADPFLKSAANGSEFNIKLQRLLFLGEMLYNLQGIQGIEEVCNKIGNDSVEPLFAELEAGKLLYSSGYKFRYIPRAPIGKSNDIEVKDGNGVILAEIKCKVTETQFSDRTISNSLYKACKQLPDDAFNVIFLKIKQEWVDDLDNITSLELTLKDFLLKTNRHLTVVVYYNNYIQQNSVDYTYGVAAFERNSEKIFEIRDERLLFPKKGNWVYISELTYKLQSMIFNT
jgi:hypothetical protein